MARAFDREFCVETADWVELKLLDIKSPNWKDGFSYDPVPAELFHDAIPQIKYEDFTFLDLGSGKGKALLLASEFPFQKIVGVDFSSELNAIAQQNFRTYKSTTQRCKDVKIICADVASS